MVDITITKLDKAKTLESMVARYEPELEAALAEVPAGSAVRVKEVQVAINENVTNEICPTLKDVQQPVVSGAVPIHAEYGGIETEHKWALERAKEALDDEAAAVMILSRPYKHGVQPPATWLIVDVSEQVWV